MKFFLVAVGRLKDENVRRACGAYTTRVRRHMKLEVVEVRDGGRTDKHADTAREDEAKYLRKAIPEGARLVALTRVGEVLTSSQFAERVGEWRERGSDIAFVLGGAHGLAEELLCMAHHRLSLSHLTMPHELARLLFLEQLYRACTILTGEPYHKGG